MASGDAWPAGRAAGEVAPGYESRSWQIALETLADVKAWLGFAGTDEYTRALAADGERIFARATD